MTARGGGGGGRERERITCYSCEPLHFSILTLVHGLWNASLHPVGVVIHKIESEIGVVIGDDFWHHVCGPLRYLQMGEGERG